MPIRIDCFGCGQSLKAPDAAAGKRIRCPKCQATVTVESAQSDEDGYDHEEDVNNHNEAVENTPDVSQSRPSRQPTGSKGASRYRGTAAASDVAAECVVHVFDCDSDEGFGRELAIAVRDQLRKDGTFERVVVTEDPDITGELVTVEDGVVSLTAIAGGMFQKATCSVMASAELTNAEGERNTASASAQQPSGNLKQMMKANSKVVSTAIAREALRHGAGVRRLRQEISGLATASMIFGILALIPMAAFVLAILWLIPAIVALVYNGGRSPRTGLIRIGIGGFFAVIGVIISIAIISSSRPRYSGRRYGVLEPPAVLRVHHDAHSRIVARKG